MTKQSRDTKIQVIAGGISSEREISLRSGQNVHEALLRLGYNNAEFFDLKSYEDLASLANLKSQNKIDLAILMTHGEFGEDGCLQGFLEICGIPYTGSKVETSAICMNKVRTKEILAANNLPVLKTYKAKDVFENPSLIDGELIIKPIVGGSSVGVTKFNNSQDFIDFANSEKNIDLANYFIEPFIKGKELTASVIEKSPSLRGAEGDVAIQSLPLLELRPKNEFYDYEAKYTKGMTEFILPAEISKELEGQIHQHALKAYQIMDCRTCARVDFIIDVDNKPYIFEINTLPGMTDTSDLPAQAAEAGIKYDELVEIFIKEYLRTCCY